MRAAILVLIFIFSSYVVCQCPPITNFDYIVVGSGIGSANAAQLAADPSCPSVLLLEEGVDDPRLYPGIDALIPHPEWPMQYWYSPTPQPFSFTRQAAFASQHSPGGSTRIFGSVNNPASQDWVDTYLDPLSVPGNDYSYASIQQQYKNSENHYCFYQPQSVTGISPSSCNANHGQNGPMDIDFPPLDYVSDPMKFLIEETCDDYPGLGFRPDYADPAALPGCYWEQHFRSMADPTNITSARSRVHTWNSYLPYNFQQSHPNLKIILGAWVNKLLFNGISSTDVIGVRYVYKGAEYYVTAKKQVFLSAGVLETPKILQLNGVGDPVLLNSLGIPVRAANIHVGAGLSAHQGIFNAYMLNETIINDPTFTGVGVGLSYLKTPYTSNTRGDIQIEWLQGVYAETSDAYGIGPAFPIVAANAFLATPQDPDAWQRFLGVVIINVEPSATGSVYINSTDPRLHPVVDYGWTTASIQINSTDYLRLLSAYTTINDLIMGGTSFTNRYEPQEIYPDNRWRQVLQQYGIPEPTLTQLSTFFYIGYSLQPFFHLSSSCRLGTCTDNTGAVNGITGLTVCDNSLLPYNPDANPTKTALAMCNVVVGSVLQRYSTVDRFDPTKNDLMCDDW